VFILVVLAALRNVGLRNREVVAPRYSQELDEAVEADATELAEAERDERPVAPRRPGRRST
jgi:hypothetical protein